MKKNKTVIIGIIFLVIMLIVYYLRNMEVEKQDKDRINISNLLEINDNVDKLSYIDIYVTPLLVAEYPNSNNAFYIVYNNKYYSVIYMNKNEASKINKDMVENGYRINGITKEKPDGIEKYGLEFLEKLFESHEDGDGHNHEINDNSYEEYFGNIYLDATVSKYNKTMIYNIIIYFSGIIGLMCFLIPISKIINNTN